MVRKLFCSMCVMTIAIGFAAAEDFSGSILKIDGDKVTVQKMKGQGKKAEKDGDPIVFSVAKDVAVLKGKFDPDTKKVVDGDKIEDGLKNEMFSKISDKGVRARVTTEGDGDKAKITKILVFGGKKK